MVQLTSAALCALFNTVFIALMGLAYELIAKRLTEWENHMHYDSYEMVATAPPHTRHAKRALPMGRRPALPVSLPPHDAHRVAGPHDALWLAFTMHGPSRYTALDAPSHAPPQRTPCVARAHARPPIARRVCGARPRAPPIAHRVWRAPPSHAPIARR